MKKIILVSLILIAFSALSCVSALDLDNATDNLDQQDTQVLEAAVESNDTEFLAKSNDTDVLAIESQSNELSSGSADSSSYLVLDNDADKENIYVGDHVTWIVSVENKGPGHAKNVKVFDQLPKGLKYVNHAVTKGTFNPKTGIWDIGNITKDSEEFLYITTLAVSLGEKINKANLTCESHNQNHETYEEEEIDVFDYKNRKSKEYPETSKNYPKSSKTINSIRQAGNPIGLIILALFGCFMAYYKKD